MPPIKRNRNDLGVFVPEVKGRRTKAKVDQDKTESDSAKVINKLSSMQIKDHKSVRNAARVILEDIVNGTGKYTASELRAFERVSNIFLKAYAIEDAKKALRAERRENKKLGIS